MAASYLEASLDRLGSSALRDDTIEICINPDGRVWGEFQGDHFMRPLDQNLSEALLQKRELLLMGQTMLVLKRL